MGPMKNRLILPGLAALLCAAQPARPAAAPILRARGVLLRAPRRAGPAAAPGLGRTAWVFATIGHSEWCPPGNVRLDLVTGLYAVTGRAARPVCGRRGLERPVVTARLGG